MIATHPKCGQNPSEMWSIPFCHLHGERLKNDCCTKFHGVIILALELFSVFTHDFAILEVSLLSLFGIYFILC